MLNNYNLDSDKVNKYLKRPPHIIANSLIVTGCFSCVTLYQTEWMPPTYNNKKKTQKNLMTYFT